MFAQKSVEKSGPLGEAPSELRRRSRPVALVAAADVDSVNGDSTFGHGLAESPEAGARRALQKEEGPFVFHLEKAVTAPMPRLK
jgi:hypothetical protein